jgi:N-dimethylarginine dimethylaminohydrolase
MIRYGTRDEYSPLRCVITCPPTHFKIQKPINKVQAKWHQRGRGPDPVKSLHQYETVKHVLQKKGISVLEIPPARRFCYQVFTRDAGFITTEGAFIGRFKCAPRMGEQRLFADMLEQEGIRIIYHFEEPAVFEGGDFLFLNRDCAFIGIGDRTNNDALNRLKSRLPSVDLHPVRLPEGYLHLDVVFNIISPDTALAYADALPNEFLSSLQGLGFKIIPVSRDEQETMGTNVLALGNKQLIAASRNQRVNKQLRKNGFETIEIEMSEIIKGGGGPRCMTLPVDRSAD